MPIKGDIDAALDAGDVNLAEQLYGEVLAKNDGFGLSGHDQQLLKARIEEVRFSLPPEEEVDEDAG